MNPTNDPVFCDVLQGLKNGDFSRLDPFFKEGNRAQPLLIAWVQEGRFRGHEQELAEALTCACFNGRIKVAEYLLDLGIPPSGGAGTGLNAIHWAANRGQLEAVQLLVRRGVPLETRSMYEGTALGTAVWAAINEPRTAHHLKIVEELLAAGACITEAGYPTGDETIDALLRRYGVT